MQNKNTAAETPVGTPAATSAKIPAKGGFSTEFIKVGVRIARFREKVGKTQRELADEMGVSTSYIGQIEAPNIVKPITLNTLFRIAAHLGVPAYELLKFD